MCICIRVYTYIQKLSSQPRLVKSEFGDWCPNHVD